MAKITMAVIEKAIDKAAAAAKVFKGTRDEMVEQVIIPLQATLAAGTKAGLHCNEQTLKRKFRKLQRVLAGFLERPSERAMRLSESKSKQ